ncbi:MAG: hypothetical protein KatS3mg125_1054 [Lysobacterales bacterium]|nr:MAG: hypothetical protein KatS3mg125_1054 [Xanthomonadales bacterium]
MANPLSKTRRADWMATLALVLFASPALAQTPVTQPAGLLTNPNPTLLSDPNAADTWLRRNVRSGGAVGIDPTYPRAGNASMFMELGAPNAGNIGKADAEYYPTASFGRLADLGTISYEWYRDAASQASAWLHPAYRLVVDADGNPLTTNDIGYLIFERCYNVPGCPAVPTNTWVADSITSSTILWWFQIGVGAETVYTRTLATYQSGAYTPSPGFAQLGPNSRVIGISLGVGSGWGGTPAFRGAVDLVRITSNTPGAASIFHNFELASDMAAVSITGLPGILGPGQSVSGVTATCTNVHPSAAAANADCAISTTLGTISALSCAPPTPVMLLNPGQSIVCIFTLTDNNTPGGGSNTLSAGTLTVTAAALVNDNPANDQTSQNVAVLDAVDETAPLPGNTTQTVNVATNDGQPTGFTYNYTLLGSTCPSASISTAGVVTVNVPIIGSCTVNYRLCADPPNQAACDTATLTVIASPSGLPDARAIPTLGVIGLAALAALIAFIGLRARRRPAAS